MKPIMLIVLVYLFTRVQGCTILFQFHGSSLREDSSYWSGVGFATQGSCELECFVDDLCAAIAYDSEIGECRKSSSTASKNANNCPTCSFSHKQCGTDCPVTYKNFGGSKICEEPYITFENTDLATCRASCSSEIRCVSFGHNLSQNKCTFSEVNEAEPLTSCPDCTYYEKECNATISVSTTSSIITDLTTVTSAETSSEHSVSTSSMYPSISSTNNINTLPTTVDITSDSTTFSTNNINTLPTTVDITSDSTTFSTNNINILPTTVSTQKDITSDSTTFSANNINTLPITVDITSDSTTFSTNNINTLPTTVDITSDSTTFSTNNINTLPTTVDITSDSTTFSTNNINILPTTVSTQKDITSDSTTFSANNINTLPITVDITSDSTTFSTNNINTLPTTVSTQKDITSDSPTTASDVSLFDTGTTPNNIYTLSSLDFSDVSTPKDIISESYETSETTALQTLVHNVETTPAGSTILLTIEPVSPTAEMETTVLDNQPSMLTTQLLPTEADNSNATSAPTEFVNSTINMVETTSLNKTAPIIDSTCLCQCFYDNETTLLERMEVRKKYLEINKKEVSSFKRSLVCASDPRYSSMVTGSLGIFVFTFIVLLVVVPDICSTVRHFIRKWKRGNLHVHKLKKKLTQTCETDIILS